MPKTIAPIFGLAAERNQGFLLLQEQRRKAAAERAEREQKQAAIERIEGIRRREVPKLHDFLQSAWSIVLHPSEPFRSGWYIELICEYLTLLTVVKLHKTGDYILRDKLLAGYQRSWEEIPEHLQKLNKLVINISPRCSKSTIVTVVWPCWEWLTMPWVPMMGISYAQSLASDHNDDRRSLITSQWYQDLAGGMKLARSKNRITEFKNADQGIMMGKGLDSGVTGVGAITLDWDDPNDPSKVESDLIRNRTIKDFKDYSVTRLNDAQLASQVIVQQRTHELDVSGIAMREFGEDWHFVIIPMEAEQDEEFIFPLSGRIVRRRAGELMAPDRFPREVIEALKRDERIWAGRYQQRPQALGGGLFKMRNWRLYNPRSMPPIRRTVLSLDCSFDDGDTNDFNALAVIAESMESKTILLPSTYTDKDLGIERNFTVEAHDYYVIDLWHQKADIVGTETALQQFTADYPEARIKLIEKAANGHAIISRFKSTIPGITPFSPGRTSKEERASAIQPIQQRGDIYLPIGEAYIHILEMMGLDSISLGDWWAINPPEHEADATHAPVDEWVKELIDEFTKFPKGANDDIVDAVDQAIIYMEANGHQDAESISPVTVTNDPRERRAVTMNVNDRLRKQRDRRL
jgi:phage terminase large subunit-like protein